MRREFIEGQIYINRRGKIFVVETLGHRPYLRVLTSKDGYYLPYEVKNIEYIGDIDD